MNGLGVPGGVRDLVWLPPRGEQKAQHAADALAHSNAIRVVYSPMTRALQTAAIISKLLGLPLSVDWDLRESLVDETSSWDTERADRAFAEFTALGGAWPPGQRRAWEQIADVRARAADYGDEQPTAMPGRFCPGLTGDFVRGDQ